MIVKGIDQFNCPNQFKSTSHFLESGSFRLIKQNKLLQPKDLNLELWPVSYNSVHYSLNCSALQYKKKKKKTLGYVLSSFYYSPNSCNSMGNNVLIEILAIKRRFSNYISQLTIKNNYIHIRLYKIFLKKKILVLYYVKNM